MSNRPRGTLVGHHPESPPVQPPEGPDLGEAGLLRSLSEIFSRHHIPKAGHLDEKQPPQSPQNDFRAKLDVEQAMSYVLAHKKFSSIFLGRDPTKKVDYEPTGTYKTVDSLEVVNISTEKSESLWRLEVERLVVGINSPDTSILFPETGIPNGDYSLLMSLSEDLMFLLSICRVFNKTAVMEELPELHDAEQFQEACNNLRRQKAATEAKKAKHLSENAGGTHHTTGMSKESRKKSVFALIDYITLVLGKILIYLAPQNATWCYTCLASLVKYTTRLKVLTKDPVGFAATALSNAEDAAKFQRNPNGNQQNTRLGRYAGLLGRLMQQDTDENAAEPLHNVYYGHYMAVQKQLETFLGFVINNLGGRTLTGTPHTTFEVCSVVYETGLEQFRTWVYQERDGDLQATACQKTIPMARSAFQFLQSTAHALERAQKSRGRHPPPILSMSSPGDSSRQPLRTHLHWNEISSDGGEDSAFKESHSSGHSLAIRTLAEAITIMVPLFSVSPYILTELPDLFRIITALGERFNHFETPAPPARPGKFKAFFSLSTDDQSDVNNRIRPLNASSLSKGLMTRDKLLLGPKIAENHGQSFSQVDESEARRRQVSMALEMDRRNREMDKWIFEETAVLVSCKVYVWTTMAFATLLAICGVVVGFTVRGRIEAVDPFNITTYCWVLSAFGILVAKSVRVETWPWRDFLHGHVRCRSVTELHSVTRIPEAFILCRLLDAEESSILETRGPFNAAFERRNDSGFSIDRPLTMWTMLLSGLIMVKVETDREPILVCLDVRRGTTYVSVGQSDSMNSSKKDGGQLACTNLSRSDSMLPLKRQVVEWNRVVGLYNNGTAKFV